MTLDALIMFSGAFVALLPFLGFPLSWDTALFFLAGIFIVGLGIVVRRKRGEWETAMRKGNPPEDSSQPTP
jgi:VIT1/CCC1 family predicted Fe2+/Mn2+ transporter